MAKNRTWRNDVDAKLRADDVEAARILLEGWLTAHPNDAEACRQLARILLHLNLPAKGLRYLRAAAKVTPDAADLHYEIGVLSLAADRLDDAEAAFRTEIASRPDHADALFNLGWVLRRLQRHEESADALRQSVRFRADQPVAWFNLGNALMDCGRAEDAVDAYQRAAQLAPQDLDIVVNLAHALWRAGNDLAAETLFRDILTTLPQASMAAEGLGNLLTASGRADQAVMVYKTALRAAPNQPQLLRGLGLALLALERWQDALRPLQAATEQAPGDPEIWNSLGVALLDADLITAAAPAFEHVLALQPDHVEALNNLGNLAARRNDEETAERFFRRALALAPDNAAIHSNLLFLLTHRMTETNKAAVFEEHRRFGRLQEALIAPLPPRPGRSPDDPDQRIRVGYVSPDFRDHAVTLWFEPVLARHDHQRFKVYCYHTGRRHDHVTQRLKTYADLWRSIGQWPPDKAAQLIQEDGIDILVDLAGHSADNGLPIFIRKPAPIQAAFIGYPTTTGLSRIDYRISDVESSPPEDDLFFTETIERLWQAPVFRPPLDAPDPAPVPFLTSGILRFGSFNRPEKISEEVWATWARLLRELPSSRFTMVLPGGDTPAIRDDYLARLALQGIAADRVEIHGMRPLNDFLRLVSSVDIALDPFPYGGGTTTMLTLWMGVALVAMRRQHAAFSIAEGALKTALCDDLLGTDQDSYIAAAKRLAASPKRLVELRSSLRHHMQHSIVIEEKKFIRELEQMYERWCQPGKRDVALDTSKQINTFTKDYRIIPGSLDNVTLTKVTNSSFSKDNKSIYYGVNFEPADFPSESTDTLFLSRLVLLEDGVPLGPPHSAHYHITDHGKGRYAHWGKTLRFSTSDNSNPNRNGRRYEIAVVPPPDPEIIQKADAAAPAGTPLLAIYDLAIEPTSFDFCIFMAAADLERRRRGFHSGHVVVVPGWINDHRAKAPESWIADSLLPMTALWPAWSEVIQIASREEAASLLNGKTNIFPASFSPLLLRPANAESWDIINRAHARGIPVKGLTASQDALKNVAEWLPLEAKGRKVVTITLQKKTNIEAWLSFAKELDLKKYFAIIINDRETIEHNEILIDGITTYTKTSIDIYTRVALYECSDINMMTDGASASLCILNEKTQYLIFDIRKKIPPDAAIDLSGYDLFCDYAFAKPGHQVIEEFDDLPALRREFHRFATLLTGSPCR